MSASGKPRVLLQDPGAGAWLAFAGLRRVLECRSLGDVPGVLREVEDAVEGAGLWAAGWVAYEAAAAFDPSLVARQGRRMPLAWFGLFDAAEPLELPGPPPERPPPVEWEPTVSREEYRAAVERARALIRSGDTYQVNYTYRLRAVLQAEPWDVFLRLAAAQRTGYGAYVDAGEWAVCSASPELFFRREGREIVSRPMKGTAARGLTPGQDLRQAAGLEQSEKDRAENVMIVDMVRNDLGRVAEPGSVHVPRLFAIERYPTVLQMTSTVAARTGAGLVDLFRALFPAASITGAPKVRTAQIIADIESTPRGLYTGAIGYLRPGRFAQFNVAIRTLVVHRPTGQAEYGVGGGIVWDSDPDKEWAECRTKAGILRSDPRPFRLLETLRWAPPDGFHLLERHLRRLQDSAAYFDFAMDAAAVRAALQAWAARAASAAQRVRLLVDERGRAEVEASPLPPAAAGRLRVALAARPVSAACRFLYHKTTRRDVYDDARAGRPGADDVLLWNERGELTESTIANLALDLDGSLYTPPVECGLLPGTLRAELLEQGELRERVLRVEELRRARRVLLLNSVRGLYEVDVAEG